MPDGIKTGDDQLDRDLAELASLLADAERLASVRTSLASEQDSIDALAQKVPVPLISVLGGLIYPRFCEEVERVLTDESAAQFRALRLRVAAELPEAGTNRLLREAGKQIYERATGGDQGLRRIFGINPRTWYRDREGKLEPYVRIRLRGEDDEELLDSYYTWRDVAFVCRAMAQVLDGEMKKAEPLQEAGMIVLLDGDRLGHNLLAALRILDSVRHRAETLGIIKAQEDPA